MGYTDRIWNSLLDADYRARYFGSSAGLLQRRERLLTLAVTLLSSGAFVSLVAKLQWLPSYIAPTLTVMTALVGGTLSVLKLGKNASLSGAMHKKWSAAC